MSAQSLIKSFSELKPDEWRNEHPFSVPLESAQAAMWGAPDDFGVIDALSAWLQKYQPCLFGRMAARAGLISYCVLRESDILKGDEHVRDVIQDARTQWNREGFEGRKSAFVIIVLSARISNAQPDENLMRFACRLCELYLLRDIEPDKIYTDQICLEKPGPSRTTWKWNVGANYFAANGDGRWWQDHRIPGGLGFSMNSVGHLVKSGLIASHMSALDAAVGSESEHLVSTKVDSLPKALEIAMRTIWLASESVSGKATELLPLPSDPGALPIAKCPVDLPAFLKDRDYCSYRGYYHTDLTVPSEYFRADEKRPTDVVPKLLDFTYLIDPAITNPDFLTTGTGQRIRAPFVSKSSPRSQRIGKSLGSPGPTGRIT